MVSAHARRQQVEYARRHGLNAQRLAWWRERLAESGARQARVALAPVVMTRGAGAAEAVVAIEIEGGVRVHVRDVEHVSATWVAAMVSALGRGER